MNFSDLRVLAPRARHELTAFLTKFAETFYAGEDNLQSPFGVIPQHRSSHLRSCIDISIDCIGVFIQLQQSWFSPSGCERRPGWRFGAHRETSTPPISASRSERRRASDRIAD